MESAPGADVLQVSDNNLRLEAGWCEDLAEKLAANSAPPGAKPSELACAAVVNASTAEVAAAGIRCSFRMKATASGLTAAAAAYGKNEAESSAQLRAITTPRVC
jgi:hypothetical protein